MKYVGSKRRIAKKLKPVIESYLTPDKWYYEPFVGGANMMEVIEHPKRVGSDSHYYLIEMYKALQGGWKPPSLVTENDYSDIKNNVDKYPPYLVGYVGFAMSFGGKWFGGYRRDKAGTKGLMSNMLAQSRRSENSLLKQAPKLQDVLFMNCEYYNLHIMPNSVVYCDPPYASTQKYSVSFDYNMFWGWVRNISNYNTVLVSEYEAPTDFEVVWENDVKISSSLDKNTGSKKAIERLWRKQ